MKPQRVGTVKLEKLVLAEDLQLLRAAKAEDTAPGHSLAAVRKLLATKKK